MKEILTLFLFTIVSLTVLGQEPAPKRLPCVTLPSQFPAAISNFHTYECWEMPYNSFDSIIFQGSDDYKVSAGKKIIFNPGTRISPSTGGSFKAAIASKDLDIVQYYPNNTPGNVTQYKKFEIGIKLPAGVESQIDAYIANNNTGLNPFDPDDIDIWVEWYHYATFLNDWLNRAHGIGFFYQDFSHDKTGSAANWTWVNENTEYRHRVRFTPRYAGSWKGLVYAKIAGMGTLGPFEINLSVNPGNPQDDFVKAGPRYFYVGNETFFPIGGNLNWPMCWSTPGNDPYNCSGIPANNFESYYPSGSSVKAYDVYKSDMAALAAGGANIFRTFIAPWSTGVEFENPGHYFDKMNRSWEMDKIIEEADSLGLKIHLDLMIHYPLESPSKHTMHHWDWLDHQNSPPPICVTTADIGNGYRSKFNLSEATEFFTNVNAKNYWKRRLRYLIARYGYSTDIAYLELLSEANQAADKGHYTLRADSSGCDFNLDSIPYNNPIFRLAIMQWHGDMLKYIKDTLYHTNHLLAVSYTGEPQGIDNTFNQPDLDIATFNHYNMHGVASMEHVNNLVDKWQVTKNINKPLLFSEIGFYGDEPDFWKCDNGAAWKLILMMGPFTGLSGMPLNWDNDRRYSYFNHFGNLKNFLEGVDLNTFAWKNFWVLSTDSLVEASFLGAGSNNLGANMISTYGIGAIRNLTYNFLSEATDTHCAKPQYLDSLYRTPQVVSSQQTTSKIKVWALPYANYQIEWYNAYNGSFISEQTISANSIGQLDLPFPNLTSDTIRPVVWFKIRPAGTPNFRSSNNQIENLSESNDFNNNLTVFPNPTNGTITLKSKENELFDLSIYNSIGQEIMNLKNVPSNKELDFKSLAAGFYLFKLKQKKSIWTIKVLKN